jgi:hypothetical protein
MRRLPTPAARARRPIVRGVVAAGSLAALMVVCSGCGGYERDDMERDLNQFVPVGSTVEGIGSSFDKGAGWPDDVREGAIDLRTPGTTRDRRIAIDRAATSHGWTCRQFSCSKGHISATISIAVSTPNEARLPDSKQRIYDEVDIDANYYAPAPLLD